MTAYDGSDELLDHLERCLDEGRKTTVGYVNVHVLNQAAQDPGLTAYLDGLDVCYADGEGVVWASRQLASPLPCRMTAADFLWPLAKRLAHRRRRVGWIGGRPGVVDDAVATLRTQYPELLVAYTHHGFPDVDLTPEVQAAQLDLLFVGMGTPIQERWIARHREQLDVPVVWGIGATHDFVSGRVPRGPRWLHQNQEWLARLATEPRRLWRRYLLGNPRFALRTLRAAWSPDESRR